MINSVAQHGQHVVIIGAGATGLGCAYRLHELGWEHFHVYEHEQQVGGLARSIRDSQGFTWDIGGHILFSHYRYFDQLLQLTLQERWITHKREAWIWMLDRFIPYPFQQHLRHLPREAQWQCTAGVLASQQHQRDIANFEDWIKGLFGNGIADIFMLPYNRKIWAHPLSCMDYTWVGERVAAVELGAILKTSSWAKINHPGDQMRRSDFRASMAPALSGKASRMRSVMSEYPVGSGWSRSTRLDAG